MTDAAGGRPPRRRAAESLRRSTRSTLFWSLVLLGALWIVLLFL
ncbi:MAG TPA: hypothetical protein VIC56_01750 [Gemmatimonadota bacterium]